MLVIVSITNVDVAQPICKSISTIHINTGGNRFFCSFNKIPATKGQLLPHCCQSQRGFSICGFSCCVLGRCCRKSMLALQEDSLILCAMRRTGDGWLALHAIHKLCVWVLFQMPWWDKDRPVFRRWSTKVKQCTVVYLNGQEIQLCADTVVPVVVMFMWRPDLMPHPQANPILDVPPG